MRKVLLSLIILIPGILPAQQNIRIENVRKHVYTLASDSLKGRGTGSEGQKIAAGYIADNFKQWGLIPAGNNNETNPYFQKFSIFSPLQSYAYISSDTTLPADRPKTSVSIGGIRHSFYFDYKAYRNKQHFIYISSFKTFSDSVKKVIFTENLSEINEHSKNASILITAKDLDKVKDEIFSLYNRYKINSFIVVLSGSSLEKIIADFPGNRFLIGNEKGKKSFYRLGMIKSHKLKIPGEIEDLFSFCQKHSDCEIIIAGPQLKNSLFKDKNVKQSFMRYTAFTAGLYDSVETENVAGLLEGKSKNLIVVGAHYDHLGQSGRGIFYGADDNASGTAAVLEIAREMAENKVNGKIPGYSVLFIPFTAEEEGLIGSEAFLLNYPFSDRKIQFMINMDMIGRCDKRNDTLTHYTYYLPLEGKKRKMKKAAINASKDVMECNIIKKPDVVNRLLYRFGSDHHGFVRRNIPSIVFFTGLHDDYHKITDTPDKIWYSNNTAIAKIVCRTIYLLSGEDDKN